jgi:hypothetical protein
MSRSGDEWIERTGGLGIGETPDLLPGKAKMIEELELRLVSGELGVSGAVKRKTGLRGA